MCQTFGTIKEQCVLNVQHTTKTATLKYGCLRSTWNEEILPMFITIIAMKVMVYHNMF